MDQLLWLHLNKDNDIKYYKNCKNIAIIKYLYFLKRIKLRENIYAYETALFLFFPNYLSHFANKIGVFANLEQKKAKG